MDINYLKAYDYEDKPKKPIEQPTTPESTTQRRRERQILPYTFDPMIYVEKSLENLKYSSTKSPRFRVDTPEKPLTKLERPKPSPESGFETKKNEVKIKEELIQGKNWLGLNLIEDSADIKSAEEIEKTLVTDKQEVEELAKKIERQSEKLRLFAKELENSDPNMLFFKNRLIRDLGDMENDLKEANTNILILMKERITMKEQQLLISITNNKLKNFIKGFIEDTKAYFINHYYRRDIKYNKVQTEYEEIKSEFVILKANNERLTVLLLFIEY